jgi:dTDP-4-dehydrorhamnose reductase
MRVLVTGAAGLLGAAVAREFASAGADVLPVERAALDITNDGAVAAALASARPDAVINCAAYNNVDGAEDDPVAALNVNAFAVRALSREAAARGASFVHFSSDFVFDGETSRPYVEDDRPNPQGVYAASKLLGDWFALEGPRTYVLRVESLFGPPGPHGARRGSLGTIVDRIRAGGEVPVFTDRIVSPSYTPHVARATRSLLEERAAAGLYHCVNSGQASWADVAGHAAALLELPLHMRPLTLETVALKARRPRFCALSNAKLLAAGCAMPSWQSALAEFLRPERGQAP